MKRILRHFLINFASLWLTTQILPGFIYSGGLNTLAIGAVAVMLINFTVVPLLKILFLPLNLLTFGLFTWIINALVLYVLTVVMPQFSLLPYDFPGASLGIINLPALRLNTFQVALSAAFIIGLSTNVGKWLVKN